MKKLFADNFDKILIFAFSLILISVWLFRPAAFVENVILTVIGGFLTLLLGRRSPSQTGNTNSGDVIVQPENLDLTQPEVIEAVENIKEVTPEQR